MSLNGGNMVGLNNVLEDPGVLEVVASPENDGPFTEEMINQIIGMLQSEGQITPEIHTVIVHTPGGTVLRVQIQQVEGNELEQDNIEEIPSTEGGIITSDQDHQNMTYIGQPEDCHEGNFVATSGAVVTTGDGGLLQQQYTQASVTAANAHHQLQNGGAQYLTLDHQDQQTIVSSEQLTSHQDHEQHQYAVANSIPSALMTDVADQVLQAANIIDGGYSVGANGTVSIDTSTSDTTGATALQNTVNGIGLHTTSLDNGVILSYEEPRMSVPAVSQMQQSYLSSSTHATGGINRAGAYNNRNKFINNASLFDDGSILDQNSFSDRGILNTGSPNDISSECETARRKPVMVTHTMSDEICRIKIDTGHISIDRNAGRVGDVIRIKTTTGQIKPRTPKFFRCTGCTIHFVTEQSLLQHIRHGCGGSKKKTSYECTYCLAKFSSKSKTMEHLRVCTKRSQIKHKKNQLQQGHSTAINRLNRKAPSQAEEVELNSDDDETAYAKEKSIIYDDDDDDILDAADNEDYETNLTKVSQKHLGPILTGGKFQCRDCDRTFSKDSQYKRHEGACTNAPLNASRIDSEKPTVVEKKPPVGERRRGRPPKKLQQQNGVRTHPGPGRPPKYPQAAKGPKKTYVSEAKKDIDFLPTPAAKKFKPVTEEIIKKSDDNIMEMLDENLESNLVDGSKELSETFLQCLDGSVGEESKIASPAKVKPTVCGLCVRHMESDAVLAEHITMVHGKDVVNMHTILTNNTDLKTHKCSLCNLHFVSPEGVNQHIVARHQEQLQEILKTLRINSLDVPCPWCTEKHMSTELFHQHLAAEHSHKFPETALVPAMKPEELDSKSLQAATITGAEAETLNVGRMCFNCGASFAKASKLESHMTVCKQEEQPPGQHVCYFTSCKEQEFKTFSQLISHIEEEHIHDDGSERRMFPNSSLFGTWLQQEVQRSGVKFAEASTKTRTGYSHTTYLCPQYKTTKGCDKPVTRCFSRLHVRTRWCHAKLDYCGRTEVVYFKQHVHKEQPKLNVTSIVTASKSLTVQFTAADRLTCDEAAANFVTPAPVKVDDQVPTKKKPGPMSKTLPQLASKKLNTNSLPDDKSIKKSNKDSSSSNKNDIVQKKVQAVQSTNQRSMRTPVPKMQFSPDNYNSARKKNNKRQRAEEDESSDDDYTPNNKASKANSKSSKGLNNNVNSRKGASGKRKLDDNNTPTSGPASKKSRMTGDGQTEETTYVLPANLSEWGKLFDIVRSQMNSGSLSNNSGAPEAKMLLKHQHNITNLPLEEQVRVFNRLCSLANIQVD